MDLLVCLLTFMMFIYHCIIYIYVYTGTRVLNKNPKSKDINIDTDIFSYNKDFTNALYHIKIKPIQVWNNIVCYVSYVVFMDCIVTRNSGRF